MRSPMYSKLALLPLAWGALSVAAGCSKAEETAEAPAASAAASAGASAEAAVVMGSDAITEEHDEASVAWSVAPDGRVRAEVRTKDGRVVREGVSGKLEWGAGASASAGVRAVPLDVDAKTGILVAAGPKLEADLTPIRYSLVVSGKPVAGTLHVPVEGTAALVANAKAAVAIEAPEAEVAVKAGPHGGVIQVVGTERYELVSDEASGEVRVYLLDAERRAVVLGERRITLGVYAGVHTPDVLVLAPAEGGLYARASWGLRVDPFRITMAVRTAARASFAVVGLLPDLRISLRASAPRLRVRVAGAFDGDVDADLRARAKIKVHSDNGVRDHGKGEGRHGSSKGKVDVHAKFGSHGGGSAKAGGKSGGNAKPSGGSNRKSGGSAKPSGGSSGKSGGSAKPSGGKSGGGKSGGGKSGGGKR